MKTAILGRAALVILIGLLALAPPSSRPPGGRPTSRHDALRMAIPMSPGIEDDADAQAEMEFMMLRDPKAGVIPRGIHQREIRFARGMPLRDARSPRLGPYRVATAQPLVWTERRPNNVGRRTRAFP